MFVVVDISVIPPNVSRSYGTLKFYKFGAGCWVYQPANVNVASAQFNFNIGIGGNGTYCGEVEFINFQHWISAPKYANPVAFNYGFAPGVQGQVAFKPQVIINVPDVVINGQARNLLSGKGMPLIAGQS